MSDQGLRPPPTDWRAPGVTYPMTPEPPSAGPRRCPNHHEVGPAARFCDLCGASVGEPSSAFPAALATSAQPVEHRTPFTSRRIVLGTVGLALVFGLLVTGVLTHFTLPGTSAASSVMPAALPTASPTPTPTVAATTTVTGTLTLDDYETAVNDCSGEGGYSDIEPGATVILTDESGKILGSTALGVGSSDDSTSCEFPFMIYDVPTDAAQYAVEVTHRGKVVNSRQELETSDWTFELTLG